MFSKLFHKSSDTRPRIEPDSALTEALARRVNAIEFKPSKGFLKDQSQPKRSMDRGPRASTANSQ